MHKVSHVAAVTDEGLCFTSVAMCGKMRN
jgi:hypothetical protein